MIVRKKSKMWIRGLTLAFGIGVVGILMSATGHAQLRNFLTVADFSAPFEVPGSNPQVLPPGTYTFKVVESQVTNNIVQISNKDDTHVYTTVLTVPTTREVDTDRTVMTFDERGAGQPQALRKWFYPHEKTGQEFVYSKTRATELSKSSNSPVPYSDRAVGTTPAAAALPVVAVAPAPILLMQPNGQSTQPGPYTQIAQAAPATTPATPSSQATSQAAPQTAPRTTPQTTPQTSSQANASLPQTAGNSPLYALIGCFLLLGGLSMRGLCGR